MRSAVLHNPAPAGRRWPRRGADATRRARAQLYNPKTGVGYNLGTVNVWPPTQPNQQLQMYSLCQVQVNLDIPAGEYNVRPPSPTLSPPYHSTLGAARPRACTA